MNTASFVRDRRELSNLNRLASGTGAGPPTSYRDASQPMGTQSGTQWKNSPTVIMAPSNSRGTNTSPFSTARMKDTLSEPRSGNNTAARTVLGVGRGSTNINYHISKQQPAKRQKTGHSKYFVNGATGDDVFSDKGNGRSAGGGKGKGKQRASLADAQSEVETIPSDGEDDVGEPLHKWRRSTSPDPLNVMNEPEGAAAPRRGPPGVSHPFEHPPRRGVHCLPRDGVHTMRLQEQHKHLAREAEVINIDSDDIESASGFDAENAAECRTKTPNGRSEIPTGAVRNKISVYDKPKAELSFIDLKEMQKKSVKSSMKANPKSSSSLAQFGVQPVGATLDPFATASSGFSHRNQLPVPGVLPLEAWSLGCELFKSEGKNEGEPVCWIRLQRIPSRNVYTLRIVDQAEKLSGQYEFYLDRDFDAMTYTDPSESQRPSVIKLQSTSLAKTHRRIPQFEPGTRRPTGSVTFKFLTHHANWSHGQVYRELVDFLKSQIKGNSNHSVLRGQASEALWEGIEAAAKFKAAELSRRATRLNAPLSSSRQSPLSAGPASDDSTAVEVSERISVSVPTSRAREPLRSERRVTRQSTRSSRTSPTPDLDELVLVYPSAGPGAVNITRADLKRLDAGQYLNDTIIEFGLKVWLDDLRKSQPELADQVHVFNSFFYKKLASKKEVADTYATVRKWTSKVDIFKKKYIIVPINENFHWYLAIIDHPANILHPPPPKPQVTHQTRKRKRESAAAVVDDKDKAPTEEVSTRPSEQPHAVTVPEVIAVDIESDGDGQEVETMLRFNQSCSINGASAEQAATGDTAKAWPAGPNGESDVIAIDCDDTELQYPSSDDPMNVDPAPVADGKRKSPERGSSVVMSTPPESGTVTPDAGAGGKLKAQEVEGEESPKESKEEHPSSRDGDGEELDQSMSAEELSQYPVCHIYTFDSLGSRHPAAYLRLAKYLQHEAVDKKNFHIGDTTIATQKIAKTPMQNNFCDCGLFVLAFVEAFMRDPAAASQIIRDKGLEWYPKRQDDLREHYRTRAVAMAEEWKKGRAAKEGAAKEDGAGDKDESVEGEVEMDKDKAKGGEPVIVEDDDDDDIVISNVVLPPPKPPRGAANRGGRKDGGKAARLRG